MEIAVAPFLSPSTPIPKQNAEPKRAIGSVHTLFFSFPFLFSFLFSPF